MGVEIFRLDGKVALITGGSKGFGKEMAQAFAEAGADVAVASRNKEAVDAVAAEIAAATGRRAIGVACDVTVSAQVNAMVERVLAELGQIDILVNNAGINIRKPIEQFTDEEWHRVVDTNLTGTFLCSRAVAQHMRSRKSGRVINLGSILGGVGLPERTAYCSAKGGIHQITRVLALEWAADNVLVNAISPGPFMTEMNLPVLDNPTAHKYFVDRIPLGRFGQPKEIIGAALFLASDASSFVTGSTLYVDGGWTAQ